MYAENNKAAFYIADAFAKQPFGGNPAGVVWLGEDAFPDEARMQKLAAEFRYSETAFMRRMDGGKFETRYFTPAAEVELCGHATIAGFCTLLHEHVVSDNSSLTNITKAGALEIRIEDDIVWMEMGEPKLLGGIDFTEELRSALGLDNWIITDAFRADIVSTGLPDILISVENEEELHSIRPDFEKLSEISKMFDVVGVHAYTMNSADGKIHTRNFAPLYGIDEESATGTSSGALAYLLYSEGRLRDGELVTFIQGEAMGRPSEIMCMAGDKIFVGGSAVILAKGVLL